MPKLILSGCITFITFFIMSCGSGESPLLTPVSSSGGSGGSGSNDTTSTTSTDELLENAFANVTLKSTDQTLSNSNDIYGYIQTSDDASTTVFVETFLSSSNPSGLFQLFKLDNTNTVSQISNFADNTTDLDDSALSGSTRPVLSADGTQVAWLYPDNPISANADGSNEIFTLDTDGTTLLQLTSTNVGEIANIQPSITADGSLVTFVSNANLTGSNPGNNFQIFTVTNDALKTVTQITNTAIATNPFVNVSISGDGSFIAFISTGDHTGANPNQSSVIFTINIDTTGLKQEMLQSAPGFDTNIRELKMSAGATIAFRSIEDYTGDNADNSLEIFSLNKDSTAIKQITNDWNRPEYDITILGGNVLIEDQYDISSNGQQVSYVDTNVDLFNVTTIKIISESTSLSTTSTQLESEEVTTSSGSIQSEFIHFINASTDGSETTFLSNMTLGQDTTPSKNNIFAVTAN